MHAPYRDRMDRLGLEREAFEDLVRQLDMIVDEEGGLWEPLQPSTTVFTDRVEQHGPWSFEACSQVLLRWLEAGFIGLQRIPSPGAEPLILDAHETQALLSDPTVWRPELGLYLFPTERGARSDVASWRDALAED